VRDLGGLDGQKKRVCDSFFEELADGTFAIYGSFEELAGYLDRRHNEIARQLEEVQWERATQLAEVQARNRLKEQQVASEVLGRHVALFAALGCCVVAMLAVIFIIWSGKTDPRLIWLAGFLMASSLASSVAFLFGKFIPIRLPW